MEELIGRTLDKYHIEQRLGEGSIGAVFRARDVEAGRDVALKVVHPHLAQDEGFRIRFLDEAHAIAALKHPGIVAVHAFGQDEPDLLYLVTDLLPGQTLRAWLERLAREIKIVSLSESLRIVRRIAWALHYAHERDVVHGGVKPSNVMLRPTDPAKQEAGDLPFHPVLTDFLGDLQVGGLEAQSATMMVAPTYALAYTSPEQCLGHKPDRRSDVYSLGALLYEMTTGRVPFEIASLTDAIRLHTREPPPPPRSINPTLPVEVERVVLRALAKRQEDRYATAREMADALQDAIPRVLEPRDDTPASNQVSLMLRLEREQLTPPTVIARVEDILPPGRLGGVALIATASNGRAQRVLLEEKRTLAVGRTSDSDLTLPGEGVSRQHARIAYDGQSFTVADLGSTNGTFLGETRLLPGVDQPWSAGVPLRIGEYVLRYELEGSEAAGGAQQPVAAVVAGKAPAVTLDPTRLSVEAGQQGAVRLRVVNQSAQVDHYAGLVEGVPPSWVTLPRHALRLNPNEEGMVTLTFHPPRDPQSAAGAHPFTIVVDSYANPELKTRVSGRLRIPPFHELAARLVPQEIRTRRARLELSNQGNAPASLSIQGTDPAGVVLVQPAPPDLALQPGESQTVPLRIRTRRGRPLIGVAQRYPFELSISPSVGETVKQAGTRIVRPLIALWVLPVLGFLLALILVGAGVGYKIQQDNLRATATAQTATVVAAETMTAVADTDGDGIVDVEENRLGTDPRLADTDGDGLTDKEEQAHNTRPTVADTDGDGLADGDEIAYGTNPLIVDSDGDTLHDGYEVHELGTSPKNRDTDGDGINDNVDPDPGGRPSPGGS